MTIAKGQAWGTPGPLPADGVVVRSDAEARAVVQDARRLGNPLPTLGLLGGDLCRTLGGTGDAARLDGPDAMTFPVDVGTVVADGHPYWFLAHLVARNRWRTRWFVAMNAQWWGPCNLGPRAHPDDARIDVYDAHLRWMDLPEVRRRARLGAHLPHPRITERRVAASEVTFPRPLAVELDGTPVGTARTLRVGLEPDALRVVI